MALKKRKTWKFNCKTASWTTALRGLIVYIIIIVTGRMITAAQKQLWLLRAAH